MINLKIGGFTLKQSNPDYRDHIYKTGQTNLRPTVDLREWASPVQDQLNLNSCSAVAVTDAYELSVNRLYPNMSTELSKLFIYYNSRLLEGIEKIDDGTTLRSTLKAGAHFGLCAEELWPYNFANLNIKPTPVSYRDGSYRVIPKYDRLFDLQAILSAINDNYSVVVGLKLFYEFLTLNKDNYTIPIPEYKSRNLGTHAMSLVGYDLEKQFLIAKNSFGKNWGLDGYCQIPFQYVQNNFFEQWKFDIAVPEVTTGKEVTSSDYLD